MTILIRPACSPILNSCKATKLVAACLLLAITVVRASAQNQYPFQNLALPLEERVNNVISLMTIEEKAAFLSSSPGVPRLGLQRRGHVEGLHGVARGGPSNWGRRNPVPTTIFPQAYGMGETWDTDLMQQTGAVEGYEVRYIYQSEKFGQRGGLIVRAANADLGRDPRWGRTEECYGEDPFFSVALQPGERKTVEMSLPAKSLAYWDTDGHSFVLEGGRIELLAGSSSANIRLKKTITVNN